MAIGNVAIQQALRFVHKLSYQQIADVMRVSKRGVWNKCMQPQESKVTAWEDRSWADQEEARRLAEEAWTYAVKEGLVNSTQRFL